MSVNGQMHRQTQNKIFATTLFWLFWQLKVCSVQVFTDLLNWLLNFFMCTDKVNKSVFFIILY